MVIKKIVNLELNEIENWENSVKLMLQDDSRNIDIQSISINGGQAILEGEQIPSDYVSFDIL